MEHYAWRSRHDGQPSPKPVRSHGGGRLAARSRGPGPRPGVRAVLPESRSLRVRTFAFVMSDKFQPNTNAPRGARRGRALGAKEKTAQGGGQRHSDDSGGIAWLQTGGNTPSDAASKESRGQQQQGARPHDRIGAKEMTLQDFADNQRPKHANARTADRLQHMCAWAALQTQLLCSASGRRQAALVATFGAKGMPGQKKGRQTAMDCSATGNERRTMTGAPRDPLTATDLLVDIPSQKPRWAMLQCLFLSCHLYQKGGEWESLACVLSYCVPRLYLPTGLRLSVYPTIPTFPLLAAPRPTTTRPCSWTTHGTPMGDAGS